MNYFLTFLIGFLLVYLLIPGLRIRALKIGFVDKPTKRKNHKYPVPLFGGSWYLSRFYLWLFFSRQTKGKRISGSLYCWVFDSSHWFSR